MTYVANPDAEVDVDLVRAVAEIIRRLEVFWARISMDADEMYDGVEVADEDIQSGPSVFVDFLLRALDEVAPAWRGASPLALGRPSRTCRWTQGHRQQDRTVLRPDVSIPFGRPTGVVDPNSCRQGRERRVWRVSAETE